MSAVGWGLLGDKVGDSIIDSLCNGPVKKSQIKEKLKFAFKAKLFIEILFLLHLISAFPIILNPPCQFFEELLKIPAGNSISIYHQYYLVLSFFVLSSLWPQTCFVPNIINPVPSSDCVISTKFWSNSESDWLHHHHSPQLHLPSSFLSNFI